MEALVGAFDEILAGLALALAGVLAPMIVQLVRKMLAKAGIQLDAEKSAQIEYFARLAILEAEEWAAGQLKKRARSTVGAAAVNGSKKLERAVESLLVKVPGIDPDEARAIIGATLPQLGVGAAATFQRVVVAARSRR